MTNNNNSNEANGNHNIYKDELIDKKKEILNLFIKKQITFLISFVLCYLPNNLIMILRIFFFIESSGMSFVTYLISISCLFSIIIKSTDPYTKKYIKFIYYLIFKASETKMNNTEEEMIIENYDLYEKCLSSTAPTALRSNRKKISSLKLSSSCNRIEIPISEKTSQMIEMSDKTNYFEQNDLNTEDEIKVEENKSENEINPELCNPNAESVDCNNGSINYLSTMVYEMDNYVIERFKEEYLFRFKGMVMSIDEEKIYDTNPIYIEKGFEKLPWKNKFYYEDASEFKEYNYKHYNNENFKGVSIQLKKYAPFVFHIIRKIDGIKIEDYKESLNPLKNKDKITQSFASGGNSDSPIIFTHDRRYLIKSISRSEKDMLIKILPEYHHRMKDTKSFLCRVYGLYSIMINNKEQAYVLVMRNMCDLPRNLLIASFDLKGSSVNRSVLTMEERIQVNNGKISDVLASNKDKMLKDTDFKELGIKLLVWENDKKLVEEQMKDDMIFLFKTNITDYSILINIHKFSIEDYNKVSNNYRVIRSTDSNFLYTFSIIDFITEYDIMKRGEKAAKSFLNFTNTNFSCQNPEYYYQRLLDHLKNNLFEKEKFL